MSLKDKLYKLIRDRGQLSYGEMCEFVAEEGNKVSYGERQLRFLVEEEKIMNLWKKSKRGIDYISGYMPYKESNKEPIVVINNNGEREVVGYR